MNIKHIIITGAAALVMGITTISCNQMQDEPTLTGEQFRRIAMAERHAPIVIATEKSDAMCLRAQDAVMRMLISPYDGAPMVFTNDELVDWTAALLHRDNCDLQVEGPRR